MSAAALVALAMGGPAPADAARPSAIVSMGDSYIPGEAGRWQGNSNTAVLSRDGTDRSCVRALDAAVHVV